HIRPVIRCNSFAAALESQIVDDVHADVEWQKVADASRTPLVTNLRLEPAQYMKYVERLAHERHRFIHYTSDPKTLVREETPVLRLPIREGKIPFACTSRQFARY